MSRVHEQTTDANGRCVCAGCGRPWPCVTAAKDHAFIWTPAARRWERLCCPAALEQHHDDERGPR